MAAEKRVVFKSAWLPWVLIAPQVAVISIFFFWPAAQALLQSVQQSDAFGTSVVFVGLDNFRNLWNDASYLASFKTTAIFSLLVAVLGLTLSLTLAIFADRVVKGSGVYRTFLIWPYAVAPAVAGVLAIGPINLGVSFYLAFRLALQAQGVSEVNRQLIRAAIKRRIRAAPLSFLVPPRNARHEDDEPPTAHTVHG